MRCVQDSADFDAVWPLLTQAMGRASGQSYRQWRDRYCHAPYELWALDMNDGVIGVVGVRLGDPAEITHIAVTPDVRGQGRGRELFHRLEALHGEVRRWVAETDDDAVGFYRRIGFAVETLPPRYPGVTRYRCEYPARPPLESGRL